MMYRKRLAAFVAIGLAAGILSPAISSQAATTKKKAKATKTVKTTKPAATTAPAATQAPAVAAPAAGAKGGKAVWGLEAESSEGYLPSSSNCAISCYQVFTSMAERLLSVNAKGGIEPWLAESHSPPPPRAPYPCSFLDGRPA